MLEFLNPNMIIDRFFSDEGNQAVLREYAESPEGREQLDRFLDTAEGQRLLRVIIPIALDHLSIGSDQKKVILEGLKDSG